MIIDINSTTANRFARCNNSNCRSVYLTDPSKIMGETGLLCPKCQHLMKSSHLVQCLYCQSIINFIPADFGEDSVVFYVERCSRCEGTSQDESRIKAFHFPEAFI